MALSEEEKKKIEEEEYRKSLRGENSKKKKWYQKTGWIITLLILFFPVGIFLMWKYSSWNIIVKVLITLFYLFILSSNYLSDTGDKSNKTNPAQSNSTVTAEQHVQQLQELSDLYCSERSKPNIRYVNLDDYISMYEADGKSVTLHPVINIVPSTDKCNKVMDICLDLWSADDCKNIAERKIWIGMTDDQLILSWGMPNDKNNTVTSSGIHSQWVYGDFKPYVYLEGSNESSLKVISWQS